MAGIIHHVRDGLEVWQDADEFDRLLELYEERQPRRVLEIGCNVGGTLRDWVRRAPAGTIVVAIDDLHKNRVAYQEWARPDVGLVLGRGLSQSLEMYALMAEWKPYEWAFVDGDHTEHLVRQDVDNVIPLMAPGGVTILHDITPGHEHTDGKTGPSVVFAELAQKYRTETILCGETHECSAGVGIVHIP